MTKLSVQGVSVSAASAIAVAVIAVMVVLTGFAFSSRLVTVTSTRVTKRPWFFDTVVSEPHFALLAIAFDVVVIWGMVGSGSPPWLEAAKSWYCCLVGIRHSCCQFGSVR